MKCPYLFKAGDRSFALVMVLAFMVLLFAILIALLSLSRIQSQVSRSSFNQFNSDLFATTAARETIGDLQQEIVTDSANWTTNVGGSNVTLYFPGAPGSSWTTNNATDFASSTNVVPARIGTADDLPNLVKRSARDLAFYPGGPIRAIASSTTNAAANGRYVSLAQWNKALLLPRANPTSTSDFTPISDFSPPDWILVDRTGNNPTTWSTNLCWSVNPADTNVVIGRYAYAIYDEGGLLDANVAGYPDASNATTNTAGGPPALLTYKSSLALADLKYTGLTQKQINALIGWRNNASLSVQGAYPSYTGNDNSAATNYFNLMLTNSTSFLAPVNVGLNSGESDHLFVSRQQLIDFLTGTATAGLGALSDTQNALQYLGTFSRDIEQPSFDPSDRPKIAASRIAATVNGEGGNDYYGHDISANPVLLQQRVTTAFTRNDGSQALVGEPLLKRRFPLSRIALVTHTATDTGTGNIYKYFGLSRSSSTVPWVYSHGTSSTGFIPSTQVGSLTPDTNHILTLDQVANLPQPRDPDFFEILKAVISAGSLGKGAFFQLATSGVLGQEQLDETTLDYQVLQIGLNIIDQYDSTDYPTVVQFGTGRTFAGLKNLPYIWAMSMLTIQTSPSTATTLFTPWVWNPNDPAPRASANGTPTLLRVTATLPANSAITNFCYAYGFPANSNTNLFAGHVLSEGARITSAGSIPFSPTDTPSYGYRFPVRLMSAATGGSTATPGGAPNATFNGPRHPGPNLGTYYGVLGTESFSMNWTNWTLSQTNAATGAVYGDNHDYVQPSFPSGFTVTADYNDGTGWFTYDQQTFFANDSGCTNFNAWLAYDGSGCPEVNATSTQAVIQGTGGGSIVRIDPRTSRWGNSITHSILDAPVLSLDATSKDPQAFLGTATWPTFTPGWQMTLGFIQGTGTAETGVFPARKQGSPTVVYHGWHLQKPAGVTAGYMATYPAMLALNVVTTATASPVPVSTCAANGFSFSSLDGASDPSFKACYYDDPDGIARRGMSWYASNERELPQYDDSGWNANTANTMTPATNNPLSRRPILLNRPFRSIAEMSYASRGMPWKNVDFTFPESGDSALLEAFCLSETPRSDGLVAGRINLNTRQVPVLEALIAGAYEDELQNSVAGFSRSTPGALGFNAGDSGAPAAIAQALVSRTTNFTDASQGPLRNRAELVGKPIPGSTGSDPLVRYSGFAGDIQSALSANSATATTPAYKIPRMREAAIRSLADAGTARVWNLLIDVVAQTGRYPVGSTAFENFNVEGEHRIWVHVAIDRLTGQILDENVETVNE